MKYLLLLSAMFLAVVGQFALKKGISSSVLSFNLESIVKTLFSPMVFFGFCLKKKPSSPLYFWSEVCLWYWLNLLPIIRAITTLKKILKRALFLQSAPKYFTDWLCLPRFSQFVFWALPPFILCSYSSADISRPRHCLIYFFSIQRLNPYPKTLHRKKIYYRTE